MLEESPEAIEGSAEVDYNYFKHRFQILNPHRFAEGMISRDMTKIFRDAKAANKELMSLAEDDDIITRLLQYISSNYPADPIVDDDEEEVITTKTKKNAEESPKKKTKTISKTTTPVKKT
jgi:hypothetical protein